MTVFVHDSNISDLIQVPNFKFALTEEMVEACKRSDFKPEDFMPSQSNTTDTGWDVRCAAPEGIDLKPECYIKVPLGFRVFSPSGWWLSLSPRSSTFIKRHIHALYGVIDEEYEGQCYFCGQYLTDACSIVSGHNYGKVEFGDRVGQLIPVRRNTMKVEQVSNEDFEKFSQERNAARSGGFGSSGYK